MKETTSEDELNTMIGQGNYPIVVTISGTDSNGLQNYSDL